MTNPPKQSDSSHSILEDIMASMPVRIFWKDRDSRFLGCNALFAMDAGFTDPEELVGKTDFDMPWKSQANRYRTDDLAVMESAMPKLGYEQQMTTAGGRKIWLHISKAPLFDEHDQVIGVLGVAEDITVQKSSEEMRQASEARFHALFDQSPLAVQMVATDGRTLRVNRAWEELWGVPFEALADYNLFEDKYLLENGLMPLIKKALDGETVMMPEVEYDKAATPEVFDQEAGKIWVHTHIFPLMQADANVQEIVLVHEDVTGRKHMEQELAEKREQHEVAQEIAHLGHWALDLVENNLVWSDENYRIFGVEPGTGNTYETFLEIVHPEDVDFVNQAYTGHVENRTPYNIEHRLLMPDGSVKWVQERCKTWYGEDGTPLRSVGTTLDITRRKQAELALHEAMEKFQSLVESSSDWIWEVDDKGVFTYASPKIREILGYEPAEVLGKTPFDFMPADEKRRVGELFAEIIREQKPFAGLENRNLHKGGQIVVLETSGVPVFDEQGKLIGYHGIDRDITERKLGEEALKRSEARLQAFVSNMPGVAFLKDLEGRHLLVNKDSEQVFGKSSPEILGKTVFDLFPEEIASSMAVNDREIIASKQSAEFEEIVKVDGRDVVYQSIKFPIIDGNGKVAGSGGIALDVTDRKALEETLYFIVNQRWDITTGEFFQAVAIHLAESLCIDYVLINVLVDKKRARSVAFCCKGEIVENVEYSLRHAPCENVVGHQLCYYPEGIQQLFPNDEMLVEMGAESYVGIPLWDSRGEPLGLIALVDSKPMVNGELAKSILHAVAVPVAAEFERQQSETALHESKARAETLFGAITDAVFVHEVSRDGSVGKFIEVNDVACSHLGYTREELLNLAPFDIDAPESDTDLEPVVKGVFAGESVRFEQTHVAKDGRRIPVEIHTRMFDYKGKPAVISLVRDIRERKKAEGELRHYEHIVSTSTDILALLDRNFTYLAANQAYLTAWDRSQSELIGSAAIGIVGEEFFESIMKPNALRCFAEGTINFQAWYEYPAHEPSYMDFNYSPYTDGEGEVVGFAISGRDITERYHTEQSLNVSYKMLDAVSEAQSKFIADTSPNKLFDELLAVILDVTGCEYGFIGQILHSDDGEPYLKNFATTDISWNKKTREYYIEHADSGLEFHNLKSLFGEVITSGKPVIANDAPNDPRGCGVPRGHPPLDAFLGLPIRSGGELVGMIGLANMPGGFSEGTINFLRPLTSSCAQIITAYRSDMERLKAVEHVRHSEEKFRSLFESASDGIFMVDLEGNLIDFNSAAHERLGYSKAEMLKMHITEVDAPEAAARVPERLAQLKQHGHAQFESIHQKKDSTHLPVEVSARIIEIDGEKVALSIIRDISERKQAEKELRETMHALGERVKELRCLHSLSRLAESGEGSINDYLQQAVHLLPPALQYPEMVCARISCHDKEFLSENFNPSRICLSSPIITHGEQIGRVDVCYMEGVPEAETGPFLAEEVDLIEAIAVHLGRTIMQRSAEKRLRENEEKFRSLAEQSPNMIFICHEGHVAFVNEQCCQLLGYSMDELYAPDFDIHCLIEPGQCEQFNENIERQMRGETVPPYECTMIAKDGAKLHTIHNTKRIDYGQGKAILGIVTDISIQKQLEEQLRQAQKMEAVGTLVGGIAHDFNNMLAAIKANVYLAKIKPKDEPALTERLTNIEQVATSAAEMVQQLLAFARNDITATSVLSLNDLLKGGLKLARAIIPENIDYRVSICSEEMIIRGDVTQLQQVLMNLLNNARDAVVDVAKPVISCSLAPYTADEAFKARHATKKNQFACWSVADNGCGIEEEKLQKIFEPFFTTKDVGKGTGLGLAMMYAAIKSHAGVVEVDSEPGKGATFRIYLPVTKEEVHATPGSHVRVKGRGETILLADDEESLRSSSKSVLEDLGYKVLEAADGEKALEIFKADPAGIDLLMTDVIMPKLNGTDLVMCARSLSKDIPVILVTGYDRGHVLDEHLQMERCDIISKPFNYDDLSQRIRSLLEAS